MLVFLAALALAEVPPPIVNGSTTQDFPQVVTLWADDGRGYGYNFCSGTLIAPDWVVTAAHCVTAIPDLERQYGLDEVWVIVGYDLDSRNGVDQTVQAVSWDYNDNYDDNAYDIDYDIGILELSSPITDIDFMPVNKDALRNADVGDDYTYVGWGVTSDSAQDSTKKRTADMPLYDYDSTRMYAYDTDDNQNVCSGDSGGAVLEILGGGRYELAGVNSFVFSPNGDSTPCTGGATGGTRVDAFINWLEDYTPVYADDEMSDADTDADSDADSDSDSDSDTDTDSDSDSDSDSDTDTDAGMPGSIDGDPVRPGAVGEDYDSALCAAAPGAARWGVLALAGLVAARRRRPARG